MSATDDEILAIRQERVRQVTKWGVQQYDDSKWSLVLLEELGEAAMEVNDAPAAGSADPHCQMMYLERLRAEVIQCATVGLAWAEHLTARMKAMSEKGE